jgi:hypothetical protein
MPRIILDAAQLKILHSGRGPFELCDASGKVVGQCYPESQPTVDLSEWEFVSPPVSEEELDRRCQPGRKTYTTAEVLDYLRRLG